MSSYPSLLLSIGQSAYMRLPKSDHALLEAIEPMMVKGKATPLQAYKYVGHKTNSSADGNHGTGSTVVCSSGKVTRGGVDEGEQIPETCRAAFVALLARLSAASTVSATTASATTTASASGTASTAATASVSSNTSVATTPAPGATNAEPNGNSTTCVVDPHAPCVDCVIDTPITATATTTTTTTTTANSTTTATLTAKPTPNSTITSKANKNALSSWLAFPSFTTTKTTTTSLPVVLISGNEGSGRTSAVMWLKNQAIERKLNVFSLRLSKKDNLGDFTMWKRLFPLLMPKDLFLNNETQRLHVLKLLHSVFPDNVVQVEHQAFPALKAALG